METIIVAIPKGGPANTDELPEGAVNKYDTGVPIPPPANTDGLPEGSVNKYLTVQQQADLSTGPVVYLALEKLAEAPAEPLEGRIYYDTVMAKVRLFKDAAWVDAAICADELPV